MKFTRKITEKDSKKVKDSKVKKKSKNKSSSKKKKVNPNYSDKNQKKNKNLKNNVNKSKLSQLDKVISSRKKDKSKKDIKGSADLEDAKKIINILTKRYSNTEKYITSLIERRNNKDTSKFFYDKLKEKPEKKADVNPANSDDYKILKEAIKLAQDVIRNQPIQQTKSSNISTQSPETTKVEEKVPASSAPLATMAKENSEIDKEFEEEKRKMEEERRNLDEERKLIDERKKEMDKNRTINAKNVNVMSSKNKEKRSLKKEKEEHKSSVDNEALETKMALLEEKLKNIDYSPNFNKKEFKNDYVPEDVEFVNEPVGDRAQTGINGLDPVIQGGLRRLSSTLVSGGPGSGKTILSMEYIINGIEKFEENGIYITFEQSREDLIELFKNFGKDLEKLEKEKKLLIMRYNPEQIGKIIESGGGILADAIDSIHARRIVVDSISDFLLLYNSETAKRKACINLFELFRKFNCTSILISEQEVDPMKHKSNVLEHQADGVILLYNERIGDVRQRALEIFKMRGTKHAGRIFPMKITDIGVVILSNHPLTK